MMGTRFVKEWKISEVEELRWELGNYGGWQGCYHGGNATKKEGEERSSYPLTLNSYCVSHNNHQNISTK